MPLGNNNSGGATYPGMGMPISQYGWSNGKPAMGPYSFLPGAQQSSASYSYGGVPSLNDMEYGPGGLAHSGGSPQGGGVVGGGGNTSASAGPSAGGQAFYNSVLNGTRLPYDAASKSNIYSEAADMAGAAETARTGSMDAAAARGGAGPNDPSLQSAHNQSMAQRQGVEQQAHQDIESKANEANFNAQMGAAAGTNSYDLASQGLGIEQQRLGLQQQGMNQGLLSSMFGGGGGGGGGSLSSLVHMLMQRQNGGNQGFIGFGPESATGYAGEVGHWGNSASDYPDYGDGNGE